MHAAARVGGGETCPTRGHMAAAAAAWGPPRRLPCSPRRPVDWPRPPRSLPHASPPARGGLDTGRRTAPGCFAGRPHGRVVRPESQRRRRGFVARWRRAHARGFSGGPGRAFQCAGRGRGRRRRGGRRPSAEDPKVHGCAGCGWLGPCVSVHVCVDGGLASQADGMRAWAWLGGGDPGSVACRTPAAHQRSGRLPPTQAPPRGPSSDPPPSPNNTNAPPRPQHAR